MSEIVKISVIIPIYNVEKFLPECLDSVLQQNLKEIEIICINDGSPDNCLKILEKYAQKDKRIIIVNQKNVGVGRSRNHGIKLARGEYLTFLDPDDFYPAQTLLETLYVNAVQHKVNICGGCFAEYRNGQYKTQFDKNGLLWGYVFNKEGFVNYDDWQFEYGYHRFIYKTEFLKTNKIFYPDLVRFQGPPFFINAMLQAKKFYALTELTYAIRCGHQRIQWSYKKVRDLLIGLIYNLKTSRKYRLSKLHYMTYRRLTSEFLKQIQAQSTNINILFLIFIFYLNIDTSLMKKENKDFKSNLYSLFVKKQTEKIFSIKNSPDKRHKIIKLLGISIKFKKKRG